MERRALSPLGVSLLSLILACHGRLWENNYQHSNVIQPIARSQLQMLSIPQKYFLDATDTQVLDCEFHAEHFNLFDYPVLWKKTQSGEETQLAVLRKISEPFVRSGRFESSFSPSSPRYRFELAVLDLSLEDSGNYTCEVYGENNRVLANVTHEISVRAPVELTYITDGNETDYLEKPFLLRYTENEPGTLRCVSTGGYPPPEMIVYVGGREITAELPRIKYTQLMGEKGLRLMSTTVERVTHSFYALAEDDGKEVECMVTVEGLVTEIEKVPITVNYSPVIKCHSSRQDVGDINVYLRCEVRARPEVTALFWIIDHNGTTVVDAAVVNDGYWSLVKQIGNGVLETKLFIHKATPDTFRAYTLVAENRVSMSTREVHLIKKYRHTRPKSRKPKNGEPQPPEAKGRVNGYGLGQATALRSHPIDLVLILCSIVALWRPTIR